MWDGVLVIGSLGYCFAQDVWWGGSEVVVETKSEDVFGEGGSAWRMC